MTTFNKTTKFRVLLMDMTQAAFGLDMQSASRIYFLSPVLNPQVAAQAIGRARRISQQKPVSVETLVLKGSIEELIVSRRQAMTQAEHRKVRNILDDKPIFEWIKNPRFIPLPDGPLDFVAQMSPLKQPQFIFAREAARISHPDEDIVTYDALEAEKDGIPKATSVMKRKRDTDWGSADDTDLEVRLNKGGGNNRERPARRVRFSDGDGEENDQ